HARAGDAREEELHRHGAEEGDGLSESPRQPMDLSRLKTVSLKDRGGKVKAADFARPFTEGSGINGLIETLPHILAADSFRAVVGAIAKARAKNKPVIWGLGGHVIKCGLAPILIDLMRRGFATGFAMNGSASIHDFEIALCGSTSEDVEAVLPDGRFGSAEETGREWNSAISANPSKGAGNALGEALTSLAQHKDASLLVQAHAAKTPLTIHIAFGTDTPHAHPACNPQALGEATHHDFRLFCTMVSELNGGGVY